MSAARPDLEKVRKAKPAAEAFAPTCPGCGDTERRALGNKANYDLVECSSCGAILALGTNAETIPPSATYDYDSYYDDSSFQTPAVTAVSLNRLAAEFDAFRQTGRWLDIGYGAGAVLSIAESNNWKCYGTEIASRCLEYGARRGWVVTNDADLDPRFPIAGFDILTMIEFLEHVEEPMRFLNIAAKWLRPGGLLYLTTPNALSLNRRVLGIDWSIFSPPEHVVIWTPDALTAALTRAGFRITLMRTEGLNPSEVKARFRRGRQGTPGNRNEAALRLNEALTRSAFRLALKQGINTGLSAFKAGDTIKVRAIKGEVGIKTG